MSVHGLHAISLKCFSFLGLRLKVAKNDRGLVLGGWGSRRINSHFAAPGDKDTAESPSESEARRGLCCVQEIAAMC
jgi:hypothetical protein